MDVLQLLKDRIRIDRVPFGERGSRILVFRGSGPPEPGTPPPDHFCLRLAERWEKVQDRYGHYRVRPPVVQDLAFYSPSGHRLPFSLTTYPHKVELSTPLGPIAFAFQDPETLYFRLPGPAIRIRFRALAREGQTDRRGGVLRGVRKLAYTFNAPLAANTIRAVDEELLEVDVTTREVGRPVGLLLNLTPRLGFNRSVPEDPEEVFQAAAERWRAWFRAVPPVAETFRKAYYYAWWVMRSGLISTRYYMTREGMTPSKIHYVGIWHWDAFFHALAYRHVDLKLAEDQVRLVLDHQLENGMIPDAVHDEGIVTHLQWPVDADVTKPPLAAWTALKLYEFSGHRDFLDEVYEPLVRWHRWWVEHNDDDGDGLCQYNHPFSSGLDDSPLWDAGMPVESPDLNTYLVLQAEALARIARIVGEAEDVPRWLEEAHTRVERMMARMWDPEAGVFWALRQTPRGEEPIRILTPFSLYPLWTGRLPRAVADRLIAHLTNPEEFWTRYPIPTVARSDPHYDPYQMWRGPTWVNINYLFIEGLLRAGYRDLARELRKRTLALLMKHEDFYEYYHPETGERPPKAAPIFGWTSAVFIELAIAASREELWVL